MKLFHLIIISLFSLVSCTGNKKTEIVTYKLNRSDYSELLTVGGYVQAVMNYPVMPPRNMFGQTTVKRLAPDGQYVKKGDTICVLSSPELEARYKEILTNIENLEAQLKRTEADNILKVVMLEAQLLTSEAQQKISSLDSLRMQYATDVNRKLMELEMRKAVIEKQKTEKKLAATRVIGETEIRQKKAMILQERSRAQTIADQVRGLVITAQRNGAVMRTESPMFTISGPQGIGQLGGPIREGSVLYLNSPVLQFPDLSRMQVVANVSETDFRRIEKGQKVRLTVNASNDLVTTGVVNRKNLTNKSFQRYVSSKVKFYDVIIDVDSCHLKMKPGLSAECEITINEARDTLFIPTLAIFERDSAKVVYVQEGDRFEPVRIETGTSGSSFTIVTTGLKGDEIIALREPPGSLLIVPTTKADTSDNKN